MIGTLNTVHAQDYLWPTDSGAYLSATFGETRSAHFHAGLDIKTWGREGYKVFAAKDGILYRLVVTERGYGNAIYLKHPDNTYTTYAHLQRFNSEFQSLADSVRMQDHSFEMDVKFEAEEIHVKKGDVIGYTGSTGIGPPHLHFEIRDSLQNPVNALSTNFPIKDDIPPVFSSLIVEPLTKNSRVDQKPIAFYKRAQKTDNTYDFGTIGMDGVAGFAVNVYDQANDVYNAYAVHQLTLMQGADTLFHEVLDSFQFEQEREMFLDRIAPFKSEKRGHQRLFGKDGHNNPFYLIDKREAQIHAPTVPTTFTIIAQDYFGNTSAANVTIVRDSTILTNSNETKWLNPNDWYWTENWFTPDQLSTYDFEDLEGLPITPDHKLISQPSSQTEFEFLRLHPDSIYKIDSRNRDLRLRFKSNTFFDTLMVTTAKTFDADSAVVISIFPINAPLKKPYMIEYYLGNHFEKDQKYGFYRIDPQNGDLSYVDSQLHGKTLWGFPIKFGNFKVLADNEPPTLSNMKLVKTDYGKWLITVKTTDELSGIESSSAIFYVNGEKGIAEYDYEEELIRYYHPDFIPKDENIIRLRVKDKAGNEIEFNTSIPLAGH